MKCILTKYAEKGKTADYRLLILKACQRCNATIMSILECMALKIDKILMEKTIRNIVINKPMDIHFAPWITQTIMNATIAHIDIEYRHTYDSVGRVTMWLHPETPKLRSGTLEQ